jgi:hypothetical protein
MVDSEFRKLGEPRSSAVYGCLIFVQLPLFHGGNAGSNPVGDAIYFNDLRGHILPRPKIIPKRRVWMVVDSLVI